MERKKNHANAKKTLVPTGVLAALNEEFRITWPQKETVKEGSKEEESTKRDVGGTAVSPNCGGPKLAAAGAE